MAVRRTRERREQGEVHPTRTLIVGAAASLMKKKGVGGLHIDDVLAETGLTRGALYHHFENVDDLIESALLAIYVEGVDLNITVVRDLLASATSFEAFRAGVLRANSAYAANEELRAVRKMRAHAMAVAATAPRLAAALAVEQQRLTDEYVALISEAQKRGWVRAEIDPQTLAVFIQAYSFGVIVDDIAESHIDRKRWAGLIEHYFETCVFV